MAVYPKEIELKMQRLFARLSEKDKRGYAAIESANTVMAVLDMCPGCLALILKRCGVDCPN
jgi:hypothetical protein